MELLERFDLQLFAEDEDEAEDLDIEEFDSGEEDEDEGATFFTQEEVNRMFKKRLARIKERILPREKVSALKELEETLGVKLEDLVPHLKRAAGVQGVQGAPLAQAPAAPPQAPVAPPFQQAAAGAPPAAQPDLTQVLLSRLPRLEEGYREVMLQKLREKYSRDKGYIVPFEEVENEVLERAQQLNFDNYEIIYADLLREKLPQYVGKFQQAVESRTAANITKRSRPTEGPPSASEGEIQLTKEQVEVARKLGISPRDYALYLKQLGMVEGGE